MWGILVLVLSFSLFSIARHTDLKQAAYYLNIEALREQRKTELAGFQAAA
jgi:hypothetical protein